MTRIRRALRDRSQAGYVMVVTTIVLPLLLMMLALAVDVAIYYFRSVQLQRAADSAALAGVTRMPRFRDADLTARDVARRNGFVDAEDGVSVRTSFPPENNKRFNVAIRDSVVPIFFGRLIKEHWDIEKKATAEYVSNIPLGSVENAIGTGYLTGASASEGMVNGFAPQNFWLAVSGPCAAKEAGDQISSKWDGNAVNPSKSPANTNIGTQGSYLCDAQAGMVQTDEQARAHLRDAGGGEEHGHARALPGTGRQPRLLEPGLQLHRRRPLRTADARRRRAAPAVRVRAAGRQGPRDPDVRPRVQPGLGAALRPQPGLRCWLQARQVRPQREPDGRDRLLPRREHRRLPVPERRLRRGEPRPEEVRLRTEVRIYPPDLSPLDYEGDVPLQLAGSPAASALVTAADAPYVTGTDVGATLRFGSCVRWTDSWTQRNGATMQTAAQASATQYNTPAAATLPFVAEPLTWVDSTEASNANCSGFADQWVTVVRIPAATVNMMRGRFRVNVRTIDSASSFGTNSFSLRAFFVPSGGALTYTQCTTLSAAIS